MKSQIFINLAVSELDRSAQLYIAMGFELNPNFSDDSAKCLVWSEEIFLMLMTKDRFKTFATKPLADIKSGLAGIYALSFDSHVTVEKVFGKAIAAGGTEPAPFKDHGFMQIRTIEDFDGHTWELFFMDMTKFPQG